MQTSLTPSNELKKLNITYEQIGKLREILIDELSTTTSHITVEHLKLVEMRIQTLLMANVIEPIEIKADIKKLRVHL